MSPTSTSPTLTAAGPVRCQRCRRPLLDKMSRTVGHGRACFSRIPDADAAALAAAVRRGGVQLELSYAEDPRDPAGGSAVSGGARG